MSTTGSWDCLVSTAVHGAQIVGGMQKPHDKGERTVGHNGKREDKRRKD
jgi:hypothetical protein